jgi:hypothetical protein
MARANQNDGGRLDQVNNDEETDGVGGDWDDEHGRPEDEERRREMAMSTVHVVFPGVDGVSCILGMTSIPTSAVPEFLAQSQMLLRSKRSDETKTGVAMVMLDALFPETTTPMLGTVCIPADDASELADHTCAFRAVIPEPLVVRRFLQAVMQDTSISWQEKKRRIDGILSSIPRGALETPPSTSVPAAIVPGLGARESLGYIDQTNVSDALRTPSGVEVNDYRNTRYFKLVEDSKESYHLESTEEKKLASSYFYPRKHTKAGSGSRQGDAREDAQRPTSLSLKVASAEHQQLTKDDGGTIPTELRALISDDYTTGTLGFNSFLDHHGLFGSADSKGARVKVHHHEYSAFQGVPHTSSASSMFASAAPVHPLAFAVPVQTFIPGALDAVLGRGSACYGCKGSRAHRTHLEKYQGFFDRASSDGKHLIVHDLMSAWRRRGGRYFISETDGNTRVFKEADDQTVHDTILERLRDRKYRGRQTPGNPNHYVPPVHLYSHEQPGQRGQPCPSDQRLVQGVSQLAGWACTERGRRLRPYMVDGLLDLLSSDSNTAAALCSNPTATGFIPAAHQQNGGVMEGTPYESGDGFATGELGVESFSEFPTPIDPAWPNDFFPYDNGLSTPTPPPPPFDDAEPGGDSY